MIKRRALVRVAPALAIGPVTLPCPARAQVGGAARSAPDPRPDEIGRAVEEMRRKHDVPGVSLAVVSEGHIAFARGYGFRTKEGREPVTSSTLFQACSLSKPLVVMAVLRLVDQGRLELDKDVNSYLRSWKIPENDFTAKDKITLRRMFSHSAGLSSSFYPGYVPGAPAPASVVDTLNGQPPTTSEAVRPALPVGRQWRYSGGALAIAQLLLQEQTGEPLAPYMNDKLLTRLGMDNSTYEAPFPRHLWSNTAKGYAEDGSPVQGGWKEYTNAAAVAGLWTTPTELALSLLAVQNIHAGGKGSVLSPDIVREMLTPQETGTDVRIADVPTFSPKMGLGYLLEGGDQRSGGAPTRFWHWGDNPGYKALEVATIAGGNGVVAMTNSDNGVKLTRPIAALAARLYGWGLPGEEAAAAR